MKKFKEIIFLKSIKRVGKSTIYGKYWEILKNSENIDDLITKIDKSDEELIKAKRQAETLYDEIVNDSEIEVITIFDENYPKKLLDMGNKKPLILYVKGNVNALSQSNISVIGTRKPSKSSKEFEKIIVKAILDSTDRVIVSGLALGCDAVAHRTTVDEAKSTIAILPSGVNVITPASNKKLASDIIDNGGCLVSEYEPNAKAFRSTYVERDKIVAAFCDATFVVECGKKSGTMHTLNAAEKLQRPIFTHLPQDTVDGDFSGNEFILKNKDNSFEVSDINEFIGELNNLTSKKVSNQLTFDD